MAFRIGKDEPVPGAIRRRARKQLRAAAEVLGDTKRTLAERIHQMRTSVKRVRALAQLARPHLGRRACRVDWRLKKVARATSALRDDEVLLRTFDALVPGLASEVGSTSLRRARVKLSARLRDTARTFQVERTLPRLAARLRRARRDTKRWWRRGDDHGVPLAGLVHGYRKARRSMKRADEDHNGSAFHRWRKAVKAHGYQLHLLEEQLSDESRKQIQALERLGGLLGEEHDLTVLQRVVGTDRDCFPVERDRARLQGLIDERRDALRAEARALGESLFAQRPRAVRRRLREEMDQSSARHAASPGVALPGQRLPRHGRGPGSDAAGPSTGSHLRAV
jgi:CHAD domain-containing protein